MNWRPGSAGPGRGSSGRGRPGRVTLLVLISMAALLVLGLITAPMMMFASGSLMYESGSACGAARGGSAAQPTASRGARNSIPANYLALFKATGKQYGIPWVILAGIGKVESDDGQSNLPGVHSGSNAFGAAGPMQIGIGGAAGNTWGGAPVHPASEQVDGVATDANGDGIASVYEPADAIAGAAKYLLAHGILDNVNGAIFAYNHLESYVQAVLYWAGLAYAEQQLGKPYQWGGTGPDSFDCSGLVMEAYLAAGIDIPRTSQQQWLWGPRVSPSQVRPGDLVFFVGSDGTVAAPGHVGLVIGGGMMIEAYATGFPIRVAPYGDRDPVGFTRPWAHPGVHVAAAEAAS